jgi:4,5-dihydroxyphthalate decarboxylase
LGTSDYEHVRDLITGAVTDEGIDLRCLLFDVEEIFFRFTKSEWV